MLRGLVFDPPAPAAANIRSLIIEENPVTLFQTLGLRFPDRKGHTRRYECDQARSQTSDVHRQRFADAPIVFQHVYNTIECRSQGQLGVWCASTMNLPTNQSSARRSAVLNRECQKP